MQGPICSKLYIVISLVFRDVPADNHLLSLSVTGQRISEPERGETSGGGIYKKARKIYVPRFQRSLRVRWKTRSAECGVWKMRSVENAGCGKCGVWKMWGVENAECGKCGVWKMRRKFQFSVSLCHSNVDKQCVNDKKKQKQKNAMHYCILRCARLGW